jgi:hypothetical protein
MPVMPFSKRRRSRGKHAVLPGAHLPNPWNNMHGTNSEGEEVKVAPAPLVSEALNEGVEELFFPEQVAPLMPELRSPTPAWTLSPLEGLESRVKYRSTNGPKGRGFRTRKGKGGRRRKNTGRRKHKA